MCYQRPNIISKLSSCDNLLFDFFNHETDQIVDIDLWFPLPIPTCFTVIEDLRPGVRYKNKYNYRNLYRHFTRLFLIGTEFCNIRYLLTTYFIHGWNS